MDFQESEEAQSSLPVSRENVNVLYLYDDATYLDFLVQTLKGKGVRIVDFPTIHDPSSLVPFLLVNDHSILVVRNPRKDILPTLKLIMRKGILFYKQRQ
jgi:hypothetical protein